MGDDLQSYKPTSQEDIIIMLQEELAATNLEVMALTLELERKVEKRTYELCSAQQELEKTNSELMQLTLELEDRVNQRTKELAFQIEEKEKRTNELIIAEEEIKKINESLEQRVIERTQQLEAANKEIESFSYSVSHDLRAPLRHINGYVELLAKRYKVVLSETGQHYLDAILGSIQQMSSLIDALLKFSRTGRAEMNQTVMDLNIVIEEILVQLLQDNQERTIEWKIGKLPFVPCDNALIRQVWINLLSNAVKFTRTRKKAVIEIGANDEIKEIIFFVRDNGVGFDMQYAQKLFGVFQRLHTQEEFEGTGIGLANVQRIVARHGGRIWAEAELNKGATFYFSLPKKQ